MTIRISTTTNSYAYWLAAWTGSNVGDFTTQHINGVMITLWDWEKLFEANDLIYNHKLEMFSETQLHTFLKKKYRNSSFAKKYPTIDSFEKNVINVLFGYN